MRLFFLFYLITPLLMVSAEQVQISNLPPETKQEVERIANELSNFSQTLELNWTGLYIFLRVKLEKENPHFNDLPLAQKQAIVQRLFSAEMLADIKSVSQKYFELLGNESTAETLEKSHLMFKINSELLAHKALIEHFNTLNRPLSSLQQFYLDLASVYVDAKPIEIMKPYVIDPANILPQPADLAPRKKWENSDPFMAQVIRLIRRKGLYATNLLKINLVEPDLGKEAALELFEAKQGLSPSTPEYTRSFTQLMTTYGWDWGHTDKKYFDKLIQILKKYPNSFKSNSNIQAFLLFWLKDTNETSYAKNYRYKALATLISLKGFDGAKQLLLQNGLNRYLEELEQIQRAESISNKK